MSKKQAILIIEDELPLRKALSDAFLVHGYEVIEAGTAAEALRLVPLRQPDVVLLDILLPGASGLVFLRNLRALGPIGKNLPVIFLTNLEPVTDELINAIAELHPAYYMTKSEVGIEGILAKVREVVSQNP